MVSGRDPAHSEIKYNLATGRGGSGRQPGSAFKPMVLLALLEHGTGPQDIINGSEPCPVRIEGVLPNPYEPGNYEGSKGGTMPIADATAKSLNCAFVRLGLSLDDNPFKSMDKVAEMARRMGIAIPDDGKYGPSIALGAKEATPLEMASAYGTIANDGVRHKPYFVERVLDRKGKEVYKGQDAGKRVIDANVARAATSVLRGVVERGTGTKARQRDRVVAGKTGTSQEWRDAWFVGYTPQLATSIWMGNPLKQETITIGGSHVFGGSYPAITWGAYMAEALKGQPALNFPAPDLSKFESGKSV
jgi:penicillin-binding protein 1A